MANERITLLDLAKMSGSDPLVGLIDEASKAHPETTIVPGRTIKGTQYKTLVRTALPTVAFRNANEGAEAKKGTVENRLVETYILNPRWEQDKAIADAYEDGPEACIALEAGAQMEAALLHIAQQFYYGTGNDAKGFPGLIAAYDSTNMVVDAGGTTASTGSSVWAVRFGPKAVQWVFGQDGDIALSDVRIESIDPEGDGKRFTAYVQEILARVGLQVGSVQSVSRIKKLTADSGKGLTDALLAQLVETFPVGRPPDAILMAKRSLAQLHASRTAYSPTGTPPPTPRDYEGIPIQVTEAISITEALTL